MRLSPLIAERYTLYADSKAHAFELKVDALMHFVFNYFLGVVPSSGYLESSAYEELTQKART